MTLTQDRMLENQFTHADLKQVEGLQDFQQSSQELVFLQTTIGNYHEKSILRSNCSSYL